VNKFLRTSSTSRLLGAVAGVAIAIAAGTAIAIAAQGSGPVPPHRPLAVAIHKALAAPAVKALSAKVSFTDNLISSSELQGSDPLLSGGTGRVWITQGALRLELQGENGDANAVVRGNRFWAYDPSSNTVYEGTVPSGAATADHARKGHEEIPTVSQIKTQLARVAAHLSLSGATPGDIGGRPAYTVRVSPKGTGGLIGAAELAWDAIRGVPLRVALYARGDSTPVLALQATGISYGRVSRSVFDISPPKGAKVVNISLPAGGGHTKSKKTKYLSLGLAALQKHLRFTLAAPASVDGLARQSVTPLGRDEALVIYGRGLGAVAVIEQLPRPGTSTELAPSSSGGGDQPGLTLPAVSIHGSSGQELDTALGTVIRFTRAGVEYTVLGSVKPAVARAAARAL
jgi:outer membrane lipoprotein-sorting protein